MLYYRTWRGHLNGVTLENRVEIYQMLCIMETEQSEETFHQLMSQFMQYWTPRETEFMTLFKTNYASRPGIHFVRSVLYCIGMLLQKHGHVVIAITVMVTPIQTCILRG